MAKRTPVQCPDAVVLYNRYMVGVDKGDEYRKYYQVRTKCVKNYKYIFWFLFDVVIIQMHIYNIFTHHNVDQPDLPETVPPETC